MTFSFRSLLIGAALLAFAPGCGSTIERRGGEPADGAAAEDADDTDDADDADDVDTDGDDGDTDGDDDDGGPIDDPGTSARSSMCPSTTFSGGAADAIAASWSDDVASLVMRDGSLVGLDLPTEAPPVDATAYVWIVAGAEQVVVSRGWTTFGGPSPVAHVTTRWFDRRGVMTDELVSEEGLWPSWVGADGTTVMYRSGSDNWGYVARLADGTLHDLTDVDVWGDPLASGWLRGFDNSASRHGFVNPTTQERRSLDTTTYVSLVDDGYAYLEQGEATPILVHVTPDATVRTNLSALEGVPSDALYLTPRARSRFALLTDYEAQRFWRVDLTAGTAELIDAPPPAGSELLEDNCGLSQPMLTSSGEIVSGLRTAGDGQAAVASISGGWEPVGLPYAQPGTFSVAETAGTFVLTAGEASNSYCPILEWDEPASSEAIANDKVQLVRPSADVARVLDGVDPWSISLTAEGGCVTFTEGAMMGTDVHRTIVDIAGGASPVQLEGGYFAWIP